MMPANFKPKIPAASRGFLETARIFCCWMLALWQAHEQTSFCQRFIISRI